MLTEPDPAADAALAAALLALDPIGLGGVLVTARPGGVREAWLGRLRELLPEHTSMRRVPAQVGEGRLIGGLDMAATLEAGRPIAERGLLAEAGGQVLVLPMAERIPGNTVAHICAALDRGEVVTEREGFTLRSPTRFSVVALDERAGDDEPVSPALADRLALHIDLTGLRHDALGPALDADALAEARALLPAVALTPPVIEALCAGALALGIDSMRVPMLAARAALAITALFGSTEVDDMALGLATRLVLVPRATRFPAPEAQDEPEPPPPEPPEAGADEADRDKDDNTTEPGELDDVVLEAARAAMPADVLKTLLESGARRGPASAGRSGRARQNRLRGRPIGHRPGNPREGARLNVLATLRSAVPWQRLRRQMSPGLDAPILVRREDFRVSRLKQKTRSTSIFVVDASGSTAFQRLAEAKGAVELLLADCYVRRDQVAMIAFRRDAAELLLPPTRSLTRARRNLAGLPGGGGTPLSAGLDAARELADSVRRRGDSPIVVVLTDGSANIARDGAPGREQAQADALVSAQALRGAGVSTILVDTSRRPQERARRLAEAMGARYLPLPNARADVLSREVAAQTTADARRLERRA